MKIFTIKTINQMGDYDEEWGATFWAHVEEQQMPIKFTKQIKYTPAIGSKVVAEEHEIKQGTKGDFMSLRKVKVEESSEPPQTPVANDQTKLLELIYENTKAILDKIDPPVTTEADVFDEN